MNNCDENWLERPALIWNRSSNQYESSSYWSFVENEIGIQESANHRYMTYLRFFEVVSAMAIQINNQLDNYIRTSNKDFLDSSVISVPIAISIPEGPLLPISVAAVHALNLPRKAGGISTVLLPLDPADGSIRLRQMIYDARPVLILTAADCDFDTMQNIVQSIDRTREDSKSCNNSLLRSKDVVVVDARKLLDDSHILSNNIVDSSFKQYDRVSLLQEVVLRSICREMNLSTDEVLIPKSDRISHIVFTSGTSGRPKACVSSINALLHYLDAKNEAHSISDTSTILLASSLSFDPCLSDILATASARAALAIAPRRELLQNLGHILRSLSVTHILCTPTLWSTLQCASREDFPSLEVIALGGERISNNIYNSWSRRTNGDKLRLCATYGVTEACVYQTFGEVLLCESGDSSWQHVGKPLSGTGVRVCSESIEDTLIDVKNSSGKVGEVVLFGKQLDVHSTYLRQPELAASKFLLEQGIYHYRTGDRGFINPVTGNLHILGRIAGEDGMVKYNGVRLELGELEAALVDEFTDEYNVVVDAIVAASRKDDKEETNVVTDLCAYIVLSPDTISELQITSDVPESGLLCVGTPLLTLLRYRCKLKARVVPSGFVAIPRIPLSRTGKRFRLGVPDIGKAMPFSSLMAKENKLSYGSPLKNYGRNGPIVATEITHCLNLQSSQQAFLTTHSTFAMLGGDSLTATRVVRAVYARHHSIHNSRHIGGEHGVLDGPFNISHFLKARNLGAYVDWLDQNGVCNNSNGQDVTDLSSVDKPDVGQSPQDSTSLEATELYESLMQATSLGLENIAMGLLDVDADPNFEDHGGRLGKTSSRIERKQNFKSNPLHIACIQSRSRLVRKLLDHGANYRSPNASGMFPLHLAVSGSGPIDSGEEEENERLLCVSHLLDAGAPLFTKDGSKQSLLHVAARAGHTHLLRFLLNKWLEQTDGKPKFLDWRDTWGRTPVHWAVLNGHPESLKLLLEYGCNPSPYKLKDNQKHTSAASESPLEICERLYDKTDKGRLMTDLLQHAFQQQK